MKRAREQHEIRVRERRLRVAFEAARLMAQQGLQDYHQAKLKAARQLGIDDHASLPANAEVELQLRGYQRLFQSDDQPVQLRRRREAALEAMDFFAAFQPRLAGPVLDGTADAHSPVWLQVHSDDADAFARFVLDAHMPASLLGERRLRVGRQQALPFPSWSFSVDGLAFELTVLPEALLRQAPLSPVDGRPLQRVNAAGLRRLLETG